MIVLRLVSGHFSLRSQSIPERSPVVERSCTEGFISYEVSYLLVLSNDVSMASGFFFQVARQLNSPPKR
jgi:hypothetical protein